VAELVLRIFPIHKAATVGRADMFSTVGRADMFSTAGRTHSFAVIGCAVDTCYATCSRRRPGATNGRGFMGLMSE